MRLFPILLLVAPAWAAELQVEMRANEVWIIRDGQPKQLTNDGKAKIEAVLSPSGNRIAYYEACPQSEHCIPSMVILDQEGRRLRDFSVMTQAIGAAAPCASILRIMWLGESRIGAECHGNPSISEYVETDLDSSKTTRDLLGYGFTPSPDLKYVAHVGPVVHFAAPVDQSNYLYIDEIVVYPLPRGAKPSEQQRDVVRQRGSVWTAVHELVPKFFWSPDSQRIAFVDCLSDWVEKGVDLGSSTPLGDLTNRRCLVAVVARSGQTALFPIPDTVIDTNRLLISWNGPNEISVDISGTARTYKIR